MSGSPANPAGGSAPGPRGESPGRKVVRALLAIPKTIVMPFVITFRALRAIWRDPDSRNIVVAAGMLLAAGTLIFTIIEDLPNVFFAPVVFMSDDGTTLSGSGFDGVYYWTEADGVVWIGTDEGVVAYWPATGAMVLYDSSTGMGNDNVNDVVVDAGGTIRFVELSKHIVDRPEPRTLLRSLRSIQEA